MLLLWFVVMIMFMPIVVAIISIIILASSARIVAAVSYGMINQVCNDFYSCHRSVVPSLSESECSR